MSQAGRSASNGEAPTARLVERTGCLGDRPLREVAEAAYQCVNTEVGAGHTSFEELDRYADAVCIKNADGVLVYSNPAHRGMFTRGASPIGRTSHAYLDPHMAKRAETIEDMILGGAPYVECEHSGFGPDGDAYRVQVYKKSLRGLRAPGFATLGVIRLLERTESNAAGQTIDLAAACDRFRRLSERDQEICRLTALGVSSRELGERLEMTTRGIELRKQKAFAKLGVAKAVDLARLLVRLQDRGYLDLGV